jgi:hypothetical protein
VATVGYARMFQTMAFIALATARVFSIVSRRDHRNRLVRSL